MTREGYLFMAAMGFIAFGLGMGSMIKDNVTGCEKACAAKGKIVQSWSGVLSCYCVPGEQVR